MKCWWCGVEPDKVIDVMVFAEREPVRSIPRWPAGDHPHAEAPPTADELTEQAYRMLLDQAR